MLVLTSVPSSGTRFFNRLLKPNYLGHVHNPELPKHIVKADVVVCAVRKPELVWASWWNGHRSSGRHWWYVWGHLAGLALRPGVVYLPIDHPSREERLERLFEQLGREMPIIDWNDRVGAREDDRGAPPAMDLRPLYKIPIIDELYSEG